MQRDKALEHVRIARWPATYQRQVDCETGNRNSSICEFCGEAFGTAAMLHLHCTYQAAQDKDAGLPEEARHRVRERDDYGAFVHQDPSQDEVRHHLQGGYREIVVLVEGIEPTTSATLQARHSYVIGGPHADDVEWNMQFVECCMVPHNSDKGLVLDLARFHTLEPDF